MIKNTDFVENLGIITALKQFEEVQILKKKDVFKINKNQIHSLKDIEKIILNSNYIEFAKNYIDSKNNFFYDLPFNIDIYGKSYFNQENLFPIKEKNISYYTCKNYNKILMIFIKLKNKNYYYYYISLEPKHYVKEPIFNKINRKLNLT